MPSFQLVDQLFLAASHFRRRAMRHQYHTARPGLQPFQRARQKVQPAREEDYVLGGERLLLLGAKRQVSLRRLRRGRGKELEGHVVVGKEVDRLDQRDLNVTLVPEIDPANRDLKAEAPPPILSEARPHLSASTDRGVCHEHRCGDLEQVEQKGINALHQLA